MRSNMSINLGWTSRQYSTAFAKNLSDRKLLILIKMFLAEAAKRGLNATKPINFRGI